MANTAFDHNPTITIPGSGNTTDNAVVLWNGTTGNNFSNSVVIINAGAVTGVTTLAIGGTLTGVTNLTLSGTLSDGNYTFDTNGNVSGLGTVSSGAITATTSITLNARGEMRFADANSSNYIAFESPATVSTSYTMTLPSDLPAADEVLTVTSYSGGAGVLEWAAAGSTFIGVRVENSEHQSIGYNSPVNITFDDSVTKFDTDTMHSSSNPDRIIFTTAGKYYVSISYAWNGDTGGRRNVSCHRYNSSNSNLGTVHRQTISPATNDEMHNGFSFIYEFNAGDYVVFPAHHTNTSGSNALLLLADGESSAVAMAYKID